MNKRNTTIVIVLLSVVVALLAGYILADKGIIPVGKTLLSGKEMPLSPDEKNVVKKLGYPDVFVVMIENGDRREIWTYFSEGVNCIFINGKISELKEQKPLNKDFYYPKVKPTQFFNGMTEKDVLKILPGPSAITEGTIEGVDGEVKIFDYFDQVRIGMVDGRVVYVQTLPFALR